MSFNAEAFSRRNRERCESQSGFATDLSKDGDIRDGRLNEWSETDFACALAGEVGELCGLIRKRRGHMGNQGASIEALSGELGDVLAFLDLTAQRLGIDLWTAAEMKFEQVSERIGYR